MSEKSDKRWYVLRVFTGKEEMVKSYLEQEVKFLGNENLIGDILIPNETIIAMRDGKRKDKTRVLFPGYIVVQLDINPDTQHLITNAPHIIGFPGNPEDPQPLRKDEIDRIMGKSKEAEGRIILDIPFEVDDKVKISDGPFKDFIGSIKEINREKRKLKVLISIFGRSTPVEVDFLQITTNISQ